MKFSGLFKVAGIVALIALYVRMAWWQDRADFSGLMLTVSALFALYLMHIRLSGWDLRRMMMLAVLIRLPFLFSEPALSDDIWRFEWDGRLMLEGLNPYQDTPADIAAETQQLIDPDGVLLDNMNSDGYHSVYPPVNQVIFAFLSWTGRFLGLFFSYHLFFLLIEMWGMWLMWRIMRRLEIPESRLAWWALNPLVVIELSGNLHFEGVVWAFLMWSVWLFLAGKRRGAAGSLAAGILTKLTPLLYFPLFLRESNRSFMKYALLTASLVLVAFLPFIGSKLLAGYGGSLDLFFRKFEFNASIYYLLRSMGFVLKGYNVIACIGPLLALCTLVSVLLISLRRKGNGSTAHFFVELTLIHTVFLLFSTTVHPWYVLLPLGFGVMAGLRYPVVWSYLVFLSYSHYMGGGFQEQYAWIAIEYLVLFAFIWWDMKKGGVFAPRPSSGVSVSL